MPYSQFDPRLSERDARTLAGHVVERLRALHLNPTDIGVALEPFGFFFSAVINGRLVTMRTGQGNFRYEDIARELALLALEPTDRGLEVVELTPPAPVGGTP